MTRRFPRAGAVALAAALVLPLQAVPALAQQNVGSQFFLNSQYDSVAVGHVDRQGQFQGTYQSGYWAGYTPSSGWTKVEWVPGIRAPVGVRAGGENHA